MSIEGFWGTNKGCPDLARAEAEHGGRQVGRDGPHRGHRSLDWHLMDNLSHPGPTAVHRWHGPGATFLTQAQARQTLTPSRGQLAMQIPCTLSVSTLALLLPAFIFRKSTKKGHVPHTDTLHNDRQVKRKRFFQ